VWGGGRSEEASPCRCRGCGGGYRRWGASTSGWREIPSGDNAATLLAGEAPCHAPPRAPPSADETLGTRESGGGEGQEKNEMREC
jgi:hypothetical protein